jgi:hypothetical protein
LADIFAVAFEFDWDCVFQYPIEDEGYIEGCAIDGEDYQEEVCYKKGDDCSSCKYFYSHHNRFIRYILDFALFKRKKKIDVELDGYQFHKDRKAYDEKRNKFLEEDGWIVKRFSSSRINKEYQSVLLELKECLIEND